ncbi:MAG: RDD family protein [Candidatus Bathyarchaeota archaeon]|nr:RDD family protein [Candidatus Bathyarchaeota archaeon]
MTFCPKCGKEVKTDEKFCMNCGALLEKSSTKLTKATTDQYASLGSRIVAGLIDYIIMLIVALFIFIIPFGGAIWSWSWGKPGFGFGMIGGIFGLQFLLWLAYFTYFEGSSGQTIGKKVANIKVVKVDFSKCDYGSAFVRTILRIIDRLPFLYILGFVLIAVTDKKQRLGDMLAKTIVVNT